jgi:hypothetical protein
MRGRLALAILCFWKESKKLSAIKNTGTYKEARSMVKKAKKKLSRRCSILIRFDTEGRELTSTTLSGCW